MRVTNKSNRPSLPAGLADQYRKTEYRVIAGEQELVFRIGQYNPGTERRLAEVAGPFSDWAMITPCNPRSALLCEAENQARLENFRQLLAALPYRQLPSCHHDPDAKWPDETGTLILDIPNEKAVAIGQQFQQNAIVCCKWGQAPALHWLVDA